MFNFKDFFFSLLSRVNTPKEEEEEELLILKNSSSSPEPGLIIQTYDERGSLIYFIHMKEGIIKAQLLIQEKYRNRILDCTNGLTLVEWKLFGYGCTGCTELRVLNPVTKQYLQLPRPQPCPSSNSRAHYGFAFVSSISKFKVVCIVICLDPKSKDHWRAECLILTLDCLNPKWRVIQDPPRLLNCVYRRPITTNGYMYWSLRHPDNLVLSVDLIEEKFSEVRLPSRLPHSIGSLVEIEGHLCNIVRQRKGIVDIWILNKDVDGGGQWVKQHSINVCHSLRGTTWFYPRILSFRKEEITMLDYGHRMLYVFDVKLNKLKKQTRINIEGFIEFCSSHVNSYLRAQLWMAADQIL
ncbi:hypothetical protein NE237_027610 [Protea cynaroides]|uniref:F-box associated beta-propeller type 3 domain-containing protein n=1 Tax=Protea cynaroides TaxID=273540 RepID=A0A9Q0JUJ6_9MAGN|nr:hypothetical protein NE237_027610 [Protea cynaroides]